MDSPSTSKKQKLSPSPSTPAGTQPKPTEEEEDPDAAPPASTAGAHAKPLAALHAGPSGVGMLGKGKGKGKPQEKEGFESVLERLQDDGTCLHSAHHSLVYRIALGDDFENATNFATVDLWDETLTFERCNRRECHRIMGSTSPRQNQYRKGLAWSVNSRFDFPFLPRSHAGTTTAC